MGCQLPPGEIRRTERASRAAIAHKDLASAIITRTSSATPVSVTPVNVTCVMLRLLIDFANKRFERPTERQPAPENIPSAFSAPQITTIFARLRSIVAIASSQSQAIAFYKDTANDQRSTFSPLLRVHLTVFACDCEEAIATMDRNRAKIGVIYGAEKADGMFSGADCLSLGRSKRLVTKSTSSKREKVTFTGVTETGVPELVVASRN